MLQKIMNDEMDKVKEVFLPKIDPFIMVIFGASGDLTSRKLIPALFKIFCKSLMPDKFAVVGVSRTFFSDDSFRDNLQQQVEAQISTSDEKTRIPEFFSHLYYLKTDTSQKEDFKQLSDYLKALSDSLQLSPNYLFYLATPPSMYETILRNLGSQSLQKESSGNYWRRIIIEKPYGNSLESALQLDRTITSIFKESQIYRIDHYLGKETVQNILVFRFANGIFEPLWNRNYIDYVEITAVEDMGVLNRGVYYDSMGAVRDMVQNHLLQLLGITAMEPPAHFNGRMFRDEVNKVIDSLRPFTRKSIINDIVRGQYTESDTTKGHYQSYRDEANIPQDSRTETFVAMKVFVDNWRWSGVPFYIRTGKALATKVSEIVVHFKSTPYQIFEKQCSGGNCNRLIIRILPDEGMLLQFGLKEPGSSFQVRQVSMDFRYEKIADVNLSGAYERLLLDCIMGDTMLYSRSDVVRAAWHFIDPILKVWNEDTEIPLYGYPAGTWGPVEADELMTDGRHWSNPCRNLTDSENYCLL